MASRRTSSRGERCFGLTRILCFWQLLVSYINRLSGNPYFPRAGGCPLLAVAVSDQLLVDVVVSFQGSRVPFQWSSVYDCGWLATIAWLLPGPNLRKFVGTGSRLLTNFADLQTWLDSNCWWLGSLDCFVVFPDAVECTCCAGTPSPEAQRNWHSSLTQFIWGPRASLGRTHTRNILHTSVLYQQGSNRDEYSHWAVVLVICLLTLDAWSLFSCNGAAPIRPVTSVVRSIRLQQCSGTVVLFTENNLWPGDHPLVLGCKFH